MQEPLRMTISFHKNKTDRFALDKKHLIYQKGGSFLVMMMMHCGHSKNLRVVVLVTQTSWSSLGVLET